MLQYVEGKLGTHPQSLSQYSSTVSGHCKISEKGCRSILMLQNPLIYINSTCFSNQVRNNAIYSSKINLKSLIPTVFADWYDFD